MIIAVKEKGRLSMTDGYIKFNDLLTAVGNMLKEMGSKEVTINTENYDLSGFCDKLWESAYQKEYEDGFGEFDCEGCKYIGTPLNSYPCNDCSRYYLDLYDSGKGDSE